MRLSCTVMEIWLLKDNGSHEFDFLGSRDVIGHVTIRLPETEFLWVVHRDRSSDEAVYHPVMSVILFLILNSVVVPTSAIE